MDDAKEKFRALMYSQQSWPGIYMFKFIVPNDKEKLELLKSYFSQPENITYRTSRDIRFIALTCKQLMENPDEVWAIYSKANAIEGVISL